MIKGLTNLFVRYTQKLVPDPFLFVAVLTGIVIICDFIFVRGTSFNGLVSTWFTGVWGGGIFTFALEMILILVTGYTLAEAPIIKKGLKWLASKPKNQTQAAILVFLVGGIGSILNWGLGLVIGTLLAKQIAKRMQEIHFGFIVAAAYMGFITWASGFSSSIGLIDTAKDPVTNIIFKMTGQTVPLSKTIFEPYNWIPVLLILIVVPLLLKFMSPSETTPIDPEALEDAEVEVPVTTKTFATRLENAWIVNVLFFVLGLYVLFFVMHGNLNLSSVIMLFTVIGMLLHWTPTRFIRAFSNAAKASGPLILQYPLYGGLMALMTYTPDTHTHSLATMLALALIKGSNEAMLPFMNFVGSMIITLFVPSGGGHWTVQGPIAIEAAKHFSQSPIYLGRVSMAVSMGEEVANMIQPFWILPLLAIAKLSIRDVMGYCVVTLFAGIIIFGGCLLLIPAI
ncbi:short-chain fatty acids transporter [Alicyclobacillus contaminans]|uniref:TIGR00366 family protein n=1 Tax=Alicyclobacillus contaminans TaxID=392016 RepID=UPI000404B0B0|nr:TIGR00366 family protein [Alicyclobacillus contaminans]GMA50300.1 short-chain fatty acids transporter [Alicyclobacillus contaminans]